MQIDCNEMSWRRACESWPVLLQAFVVAAACLAAYSNALGNDFVVDDVYLVLNNPWIRDAGHLNDIFTKNFWAVKGESSSFYRPMVHLFHMLSYRLFGMQPWGFHLMNVLLHAGVSVMVLLVVRRLVPGRGADERGPVLVSPAFIAAALFAVHPIHTESVTWVSGITDVSCTLFFLASFYLYIKAADREDVVNAPLMASAALFGVAAMCKEPALTLPLILAAYEFAFMGRPVFSKDFMRRLSPYLAAAVIYLALRLNAFGELMPKVFDTSLNAYSGGLNAVFLFGSYIIKLFLPVNLNFWHVFKPLTTLFSANGILPLVIAILFVLCSAAAARKNRTAFFGLMLVLLPLAPALYIPALTQGMENAFTERYLYLPSVGFVFLIASFTAVAAHANRSMAAAVTAAFVLTGGIYFFGTYTRNPVWHDHLVLWSDCVKKDPEGFIPHKSLGDIMLEVGPLNGAIGHLETAVALRPGYHPTVNSLGIAYARAGMMDKAIEQFEKAREIRPDIESYTQNLEKAREKKRRIEQAGRHDIMR